ncbi:MAG: RidA family protein [Pseudomonadota bacterium]
MQRIPVPGRGRCEAVVSDGLAYIVVTDPQSAEGVTQQTENSLAALDRLLAEAGSGKAGLLQATVYLNDIADKPAMDAVWIPWIGPEENWPQRACVGVSLEPGTLVEIVVTAKLL